jgi:hypothetical protein
MEFAEPIPSQVPSSDGQSDKKGDVPESGTEKAVHLLEEEVDQLYGTIETKFQQLWQSASKEAGEINEKYNLDERKNKILQQLTDLKKNPTIAENLLAVEQQLAKLNIDSTQLQTRAKEAYASLDLSTTAGNAFKTVENLDLKSTANNALDSLDSQLEKVENAAVSYVSSFASFFSNAISVVPEATKAPEAKTESKKTLFVSPLKYGTTRFQQDLFKLHTDETGYFKESSNGEKFDVDAKTKEISDLLQEYPELNNLMNKLVPVKLAYGVFWERYFQQHAVIEEAEAKRNQLKKEHVTGGDEDEFNWDDDEEEETEADNSKNSIKPDSDEKEENEKNNSAKPDGKVSKNAKKEDVGDVGDQDEEDDDWE